MNSKVTKWLIFPILLVMIVYPGSAQREIVLSIALPEWQSTAIPNDYFQDFENDHPGSRVIIVPQSTATFSFIANQALMEETLEAGKEWMQQADLIYVDQSNLSIEFTRAGYFLDIKPLLDADVDFQSDAFFSSALASFQWDNATWGLPTAIEPIVLVYNKPAFDNNSLSYPNEQLDVDELAHIVDIISNTQTEPVFFSSIYMSALLMSLYGEPLLDMNSLPNSPKMSNQALADVLNTWGTLERNPLFVNAKPNEAAPLRLMPVTQLDSVLQLEANISTLGWTLLPGGKSILDIEGFVISAGTQDPQLSYQLLKYLSNNDFYQYQLNPLPARKDAFDTIASSTFNSSEIQALTEEAIANAIPVPEMFFLNQLLGMSRNEGSESIDIYVLNDLEVRVSEVLELADQKRQTQTLVVTPPDLPSPNESTLVFKIDSGVTVLPNEAEWDQFLGEFLENTPSVDYIDLQIGQVSLNQENVDCYIQTAGSLQLSNNLLADLKPLTDSDMNFVTEDFWPTVLEAITHDNTIKLYPVAIYPSAIAYNADWFEENKIPIPDFDWTVNDALLLFETIAQTDANFSSQETDVTRLMLMAALGGLPIDHRTQPPIIELTDESNQLAIQIVLDLARKQWIEYSPLAIQILSGGGGTPSAHSLVALNLEAYNPDFPFTLIPYPVGSVYTPVSYRVKGVSVMENSLHKEVCYDLAVKLGYRPDLTGGMPARSSVFNTSLAANVIDPTLYSYYQGFSTLLVEENVLFIPNRTFLNGPHDFEMLWIGQVFDDYVLNETDNLGGRLNEVQEQIELYRECLQSKSNTEDSYITCASTVDPSIQVER